MDDSSPSRLSIAGLILIPAVITLAVTILRLEGELQHWSRLFFNPAAGGGGAIVGITWLPIIFGPYFALKLADSGRGAASLGKSIGFAILGIFVFAGGVFLGFAPVLHFPGKLAAGLALIVISAALQFVPWRALAKTLLAYAYTARIPVAVIMYLAIRGSWGTHYDALPPEAVPSAFWPKYVDIALIPQLVMWIAYTMIIGALFGAVFVALARRKKQTAEAA
ncbi:MAG: hypothetical protein ACRD1N_05630 [Terriglobia bacterium]